jgi:hypothetical protein
MTTYQRTRSDAKKAAKTARKGMKLYVIKDVARNIARYEDAQLYSEYVVTHRQAITGAWMISGSLSVEGLVLRDGPVYTSPPRGVRNIATPGPQVAGPDAHRVAEKAGWFGKKKPAAAGRR